MSARQAGLLRRTGSRIARSGWQRAYTAATLVLILLVAYIVRNGAFSSIDALGITNDALPLALAATGETFVILTNGIDLSIASVVTLSNVIVAVFASHGQAPLGIAVALAAGAGAGLINGLIVSYARIAPLIATLATSSVFLGIALIVLPNPGGTAPGWLTTWTSDFIGSIPVAAIWLAVAMVGGWLLLRRTSFGIHLQALGGSEPASWAAGISVTRIRILAYVASGVCSALAGVVLAGLTQSGDPSIGNVYLLNGVAAVVVGGTSLAGGVGTIAGSVLGAVALALVSALLLVSGLSTDYQYIVTGVIVIGALLAHSFQAKLGARAPKKSALGAEAAGSEA
jgi:ribose transport system permease protein